MLSATSNIMQLKYMNVKQLKKSKNYGRKYMYARLLISRENGVNMKEPQQLF